MSTQSWLKKYEPTVMEHVIGQERHMRELENFLKNFKSQKRKAVLILGPVGCGKTSSVLVLARSMNAELIEVNASDARNAEEIETKVGQAATQQSLFFRTKIILIDEVDGLSGQQDRGGIPALVRVIEKSAFPLVLTAMDVSDSKFSPLKKACHLISFDALPPSSVSNALMRICISEGVKWDEMALSALAHRCGGDLRAAINDLQSLSQQSKSLLPEHVAELDARNKVEKIEDALIKVFKVADAVIASTAFESVGEDLDECILWIEENLPKEYDDPQSLARACNALARADVYRGRIRRWQHWRFLAYVSALMTAGVASAKDQRKRQPVKYERSKRLLSIYIMNMKYAKRKSIAQKLAIATHTSKKRALQDSMPFLVRAGKRNPAFAESFSKECDLDDEEIEWLRR